MLLHLSIHQFALIEQLDLEFQSGLSVITGETGAGKSILLDALGLACGQRGDAGFVRHGADKAEITATFSINERVQHWCHKQDIPLEDDTLLLKRIITREGRSRASINGRSISLAEIRNVAEMLISVHSQNGHHQLLSNDYQRQVIDLFGGLDDLVNHVALAYQNWQQAQRKLHQVEHSSQEQQAQQQLLSYQVAELRELSLIENEYDDLDSEHKRLANADSTQLSGQSALIAIAGDDRTEQSAMSLVNHALQQLNTIDDQQSLLNECRDLLMQTEIQLQEAGNSLQHYLSKIDINPHRLQQVEQRLSDLHKMARKHLVAADKLYDHWQEQEELLADLCVSDEDLEQLRHEVTELQQSYQKAANDLSQQRQKAAALLANKVTDHFSALALGKAIFSIDITQLDINNAQRHGIDDIEFLVQTNPGSPTGNLAKVASGGELSRISLAIQVVIAATCHTPALIFDEVDVGIGGGTAERVGRLMRSLGNHCQVMSVTHQPQVAAQAHQHFQISKISGSQATHTQVRELSQQQRRHELARMLGGVEITQQTLSHAEEMLQLAGS